MGFGRALLISFLFLLLGLILIGNPALAWFLALIIFYLELNKNKEEVEKNG